MQELQNLVLRSQHGNCENVPIFFLFKICQNLMKDVGKRRKWRTINIKKSKYLQFIDHC